MNTTSRLIVTLFTLFLLTTICSRVSTAQEEQPAAPPAETAAAENAPAEAQPEEDAGGEEASEQAVAVPGKSIGGMIVSGGVLNVVFFGILGVFSLWAATVVLERVFHLRREKVLPATFASELAQLTESPQSEPSKLTALCQRHDAPVSRILDSGLKRAGRPLPEIEKAMEDAAAREMSMIRAKSRPLSVVGNIAPLVGLLGTVVGMIMAFQISSEEGLGKAERLAEGIYLALMTTAAGLTIAIPCLLFASRFAGRAERFMCDIAECLGMTMPSFARMEGKPLAIQANGSKTQGDLSPRERFLHEGEVQHVESGT